MNIEKEERLKNEEIQNKIHKESLENIRNGLYDEIQDETQQLLNKTLLTYEEWLKSMMFVFEEMLDENGQETQTLKTQQLDLLTNYDELKQKLQNIQIEQSKRISFETLKVEQMIELELKRYHTNNNTFIKSRCIFEG